LLTLENARTHDTVLNATFCFALLNYGPCLHYTTDIRQSLRYMLNEEPPVS